MGIVGEFYSMSVGIVNSMSIIVTSILNGPFELLRPRILSIVLQVYTGVRNSKLKSQVVALSSIVNGWSSLLLISFDRQHRYQSSFPFSVNYFSLIHVSFLPSHFDTFRLFHIG
jgi:hypothetical protein